MKVVVNSPLESALDLRVDVGDPEVDDPGAFGAVTAQAAQVRESDLQFIQRYVENSNGAVEEEWEIQANGFVTAGSGSVIADIPPALERLVYLQGALEVAQGATMRVDLQGADIGDAVLAHLIGVSGAGRYEFLADGGPGADLLAVLTRGLDASGGATMAFDVSGGGDDDVLGLARPTDIVPGTPIAHALAGGAATDACFTPQTVSVTACERLEPIGDELLRLIETTFGAQLADVWRQ
ncbi:MAG: hypothetical protein GWN02_17245 [Gemmatimonadetes bacterium]|nr:hypothetical protein [Gemmatimonadota bacterium]NIY09919.1 hypothetical protein [Gemmatimonadota bacterium]